MAHTTEGVTEFVEAVAFSFMTVEEVHKHSVVKITNPILLDVLERPVPGGLYDPTMGPMEERTPCMSCGQRSFSCPGHFGHIDLVSLAYNPLLFNILYNLLQRTCFLCHHFRASREQVKKCISQLELIIEGDIVTAKKLDSDFLSESPYQKFSAGHKTLKKCRLKHGEWTSLQFTEAMSVLDEFLRHKQNKCKNCGAKNPKITKPTFGWFNMIGMSVADKRANVIRGCSLKDSIIGGVEGSSLEEENTLLGGDSTVSCENDLFGDSSTKTQDKTADRKKYKHVEVPVMFLNQKEAHAEPLLPSQVKYVMNLLWENEAPLCSFITNIHCRGEKKADVSIFFLESVLVPPIKFRPPTKGGDSVMEHPQTVLLNKVLQSNISLGNAHINNMEYSKIVNRWMDLQQSINVLFDSKTAGQNQRDIPSGICQLLEKKEGMFRQKMMGKRVNFACRSVISPDPYLAVNEIGIPPYFAVRLTYPERVTPWNVMKLRNAIINGPENHPGATHYSDKLSTVKLQPNRKARISVSRKLPSSRGVVLDRGKDYELEGKVVSRHLQDGDVVLVNRQPTLHKPSIMAHVVRVLKGEKTIRMHYANCSTYNADFDGDEMNVHFPQDEISRAEAYNIVNANNQYVKPTSGEPIRALIQDHIVSAVLLTKKDTFLTFDEFSQLLYCTGVSSTGQASLSGKSGQKIFLLKSEDNVQPLLPAIWKPAPLWTGKQVITALLNHITRHSFPFSVEKDAKIPRGYFKCRSESNDSNREVADRVQPKKKADQFKKKPTEKKDPFHETVKKEVFGEIKRTKNNHPDEDNLFIYKNDLVRGVIDKAQFGDYGMVHTVHELYGPNTAGLLLSVLSRLFTIFLQMHGFTCGVDDLLLIENKDRERESQLNVCEDIGEQVHRDFLKLKENEILDPLGLQSSIEKTIRSNGESALTSLDRRMTSQLNERTGNSKVLKNLLSDGLLKPSVKNCISLMTTSGAKGGTANFQQISSHLGQQQLEGKRVPRMVSGKTLPCFPPWDWASRSGGFIVDRFLSGLRPQEYYFHCMAGREGLVDTAVKTSRSGYLQRCLIKNLESLKISYDHTVRDADGSIVQFFYGEDGVDVHQTAFITKFEALASNAEMINRRNYFQFDKSNNYVKELPSALRKKADSMHNSSIKERIPHSLKQDDLLKLLEHKYLSSLAQPGEPVGVLAAQSIGEPSTQMTYLRFALKKILIWLKGLGEQYMRIHQLKYVEHLLRLNTFHHAGRGEANVTLGIPRLQEILMTASQDIKTPIMTCPLQVDYSVDEAKLLADKLKKVTVADMIESMKVTVIPFSVQDKETCSIYKLEMKLYPVDNNPNRAYVSSKKFKETLDLLFVRELEDTIQNELILLSRINGIKNFVSSSQSNAAGETDDDLSSKRSRSGGNVDSDDDVNGAGDGDGAEDFGFDAKRQKLRASDEMDYEDDSEEEPSAREHSDVAESEVDQADNEMDNTVDVDGKCDSKDALLNNHLELENGSKSEVKSRKTKSEKKDKKSRRHRVKKNYDRAIFVSAKGNYFEVHFRFINEPHVLLAQIAERTAKKVHVQSSGRIESCHQITCKESQVIYYGHNPKDREEINLQEKEKIPALQTTGVDFPKLWALQDKLDTRYIYSNNIHAMLTTYGVEAARETIIREIRNIFKSYGISVNIRHLTLVADFMTHSGGYRPMNRLGGIAESVSPFSKMSFETASKFIVEAAYHREVDSLETPSSRICLGLPPKVGTGCFDLMQKIKA